MKSRFWIMGVAACLALGGAWPAGAATYYIDDGDVSNTGDIYTPTAYGNDANNGLTPTTPKKTLANLAGSATLAAGDIVYIDTGTYSPDVISNTVAGVAGTNILFQGSTNGAVYTGGVNLTVRGSYLTLADIRTLGGTEGIRLDGAKNCVFERIVALTNGTFGFNLSNAGCQTNLFRNCTAAGAGNPFRAFGTGNAIQHSVLISYNSTALQLAVGVVTNVQGCVLSGSQVFVGIGNTPFSGTRNVLWNGTMGSDIEKLSDLLRGNTNWYGNTVADPLFVNAGALDFHLLSTAGYATNGGGAVTNLAAVHSPAIDFGPAGADVGAEPAPNGGRPNAGAYGGTAEASKSRTNDWLFAMSYNDGGTLVRTGRLEWVAGNLGAGATVNLQYSTNNWATTNTIATGISAAEEKYDWAPTFSYPAVRWRVVSSTNPAAASTNAQPFSVRRYTNTTFTFYVNDGSTVRDIYGMGLGSDANDGAAASRPKDTLQAILSAYQLAGGDAVYVDTGEYLGQTTTIGRFDSGSTGMPVRIVGSTNGTTFNRGNTSANVLDISGASFLEIENLRLTGGQSGLYGSGSSDVALRNVQCLGNGQNGVYASGTRHTFDYCVSAGNGLRSYYGGGTENRWQNGVMWGSPTVILASSNTLSVSNSILVGNGPSAVLFGSQVVPGGYNLVWDTGVGTHSSFTVLQDAGLGWSNSLYADPLFADAAGFDFHPKSEAGRFDTNAMAYVTVDATNSPAIDLGDPATAVSNEPAPNGDRMNAGVFGNTAQASKSRTNGWVQLASYMDGGTLDAQAGAWVRWNGGGAGYTNGFVTIWFSRDGGKNWEVLATHVPAADGHYYYQDLVADDTSSRTALLKVELEGASPEASSQSPTNFIYRNGTFSFYINDDYSSTNDVYCTAAGDDDNEGASPGGPMRNLHALLAKVGSLGPGDRIYIDTGVYVATNTVRLTSAFSGAATNLVVIAGSTNRLAGGSLFRSGSSRPLAFDFQTGASNIVLRDVAMSNVVRGVAMTNAVNVTLDGVEVRGASSRAFDLQGNARSNLLVRCVAHGGGTGVYLSQVTNVSIQNCVFWQNTAAAATLGNSTWGVLENSILASTNLNAVLISASSSSGFTSDYNGLYAGPLTRVGSYGGTVADNLAAWQRASGGWDLHSIPAEPRMADPDSFDYHLKTEQTLGRLQSNGLRTSDDVSSPLLDAGNPASAYANEPAPNGNRVNLGRWGGTAEASIAVNSPWLKTASFGDAGFATNGAVPLVWTAGGGFSNETVTVDVSTDGGKTWGTTVTSGIAATNEMAVWNLTGLPDTPAGIWRVSCLERTNVSAQSTTFFSIRNSNLNVYVNGPYTNQAVYATAPGRSDNWMASSNAPLDSVAAAFDRFDLEPGDRIWVDRATYVESTPIQIGMKNSGSAGNPVQVTGNPAAPYAGTILARNSRSTGAYGIQLSHATGVQLSNFMVSNAYIGIHAENSLGIELDRVRAAYCFTNAIYAGAGVQMDANRIIVDQSLSAGFSTRTGATVKIYGSLFRENLQANLHIRGGSIELKNSILEATGDRRYVYYWAGGGTLDSDYNNVRVSDGANVAGGDGRAADRFLIDWQTSTAFANDKNSFGYDPRFADSTNRDFHLQSEYGRYDPALGVFTTNDLETSVLIDLGDPAFGVSNEPTNNGSRINVGLYGNTAEASKSSGAPTLVPLTMSDGGTIRGPVTLYWAWNGIAGSNYVNVLFSGDGGTSWTNIGHDYISAGYLDWNSTNVASTAMGVWRVELESDPNVFGQTETLFAIKNEPLAYYLNDGDTNGDVYCSAAGSSANTGLETNSPLTSLATLLARYKIEHGDTVYVDTGVYPLSSTLEISIPTATAPTNYLVIQGSTNEVAGGSVFTNSSGTAIELQNSRNVEFRDLRIHGGSPGLLFTQSSSNRIYRVRSVGARGNAFDLGILSDQNRFIQCAALGFYRTGFHVATPIDVTKVAPATNHWISGVISPVPATSNGTATGTGVLVSAGSGRIYLSNSVLVANGPAHDVYSVAQGVVHGDYNVYHRPYVDSMFVRASLSAAFGVRRMPLEHLSSWAEWNQSDSNSVIADPLFVDLAGGDLHPRSAGGHYDPATGSFVEDEETSPLIDMADPAMAVGNESAPNGNRANVGLYGGTEFASRTSPTNGAGTFVLRTFNQGGIASGIQTLRWTPQGEAFTAAVYTVNIRISTNSGATYQTVGTNPALAGSFTWDTTAHPSLPTVRWQVQCREVLAWTNASQRDFTIRNTNAVYYVNDAETNADAYCSAAGSSTNTGRSAGSPLDSLASVLSQYDLEPGDEVRIDTGNYSGGSAATVGYLDSGTAAEPIVVQGSTNEPGSVFGGSGIGFDNAKGVTLKNVRFQSPNPAGVAVASSEDLVLERVDVSGGGDGVTISASSNILARNFSVAWATNSGVHSVASFNTRLEFGTLWSNGASQVSVRNQPIGGNNPVYDDSSVSVSNCILGSFGIRIPAYLLNGTLQADYNNLYLANGALAALSYEAGFGREFDSVGVWASSDFAQDSMSLSHDPRFADALGGDFHLRSVTGRWDAVLGDWVSDGESSPLIDAGDPLRACTEPAPNGGRANLGRHGNTEQASRTPTNGAIALISFNDGGRASGTNVLVTWLARGAATTGTVTISYSSDGGLTWTELVAGIAAGDGAWTWDTTLSAESVEGKLKLESSDGSTAISTGLFSVRNGTFAFYINDDSRTNDVYCSAVGQGANSGLTPDKPMSDFNALLAKYDLEGGDIVYIDTGVYQKGSDPWRITQADSAGNLGVDPVIFQGSTNSLMNGTVLSRSFYPVGIQADYAVGIRLRNLVVSNSSSIAVSFNDCYDAAAEWVAVGVTNVGFKLTGGSHLRIEHCVVADANQGVIISGGDASTNTVYPVIEHNVIWETDGNAVQLVTGKATVQHNVLSVSSGYYIYGLDSSAELFADYNSIWLGDSGRVFQQSVAGSPVPLIYDTVGSWATSEGQDLHSYDGDPLLADATNRNFHLKSRAGRWDPVLLAWTNDAVSSPLIDMGDPDSTAWENEPTNSGGRVNVGLYGGTAWASKSETNSTLYVLTLNRGGVASGQVDLNWMASGAATGHTVRLYVSIDDGDTWNLVAGGLPASLGGIPWNSASLPSSPLGRWRVQDEVETNVVATSELPFVLHNGPVLYYVNDENPDGDVYCSTNGSSAHSGLSPASPKRWISEIVDAYNLEAGDVIYVDTGYYQAPGATTFGEFDAGGMSPVATQQVNIIGSTNSAAGGSVYILADPAANGFHLDSTYGIRFAHLGIKDATNGIYVDDSFFVAGEWLEIQGCENGILVQQSSNAVFRHSALVGNRNAGIQLSSSFPGPTLEVGSCVLWSNRYGLYLNRGYADVSNSIFGMVKPESFGIYMRPDNPPVGVRSEYNSLYVPPQSGSAAGGYQTGTGAGARTSVYASVSAWALASGQDVFSLAHDPQLADPDNGDFHLKSAGGRYVPGIGWVDDSTSSPLIDSGPPHSMEWTEEPTANGERVNIGLYGGTGEASKTPLEGWLTLLTLNDGGTAAGDVELKWSVGGDATNHTVCIEYSPDDGITWIEIVCGWDAGTGSYPWNSVPFGRSALGRWRIRSQNNEDIVATSLTRFVLRNGGAIPYFVNDSSTNGDVYCTAVGSAANDGLTSNRPMDSLQAVFDTYDLDPEDIVYVDAGTYMVGSFPIKIDQTDSGWSNLYVTVQGSTNPAAPSVFAALSFSAPSVFSLEYAVNVRVKNLTMKNAQIGVSLDKTIGCEFDTIRIEYNRATGLSLAEGESTRLLRSVLWNNDDGTVGNAVAIAKGNLAIENCVLWGSPTAIALNSGSLTVTNSVLDASGSDGRIYQFSAGMINSFHGDYNSYTRRNGALICEQANAAPGAGNDLYNNLPSWNAASSSDWHSMTLDPAFANETTGDFHPKSTGGRYAGGSWVYDAVLSPLVDAGGSAWPVENEPAPNGGIVNLGAYGTTAQASMTQTNPPWLHAVSYDDEGVMADDVLLYWLHGGMPTNALVTLEYSTDFMITWKPIASNVLASTREYLWDVSTMPLSLGLNWRVVYEGNTNVWDASDEPVLVKTGTYDYYVNDNGPTNVDVYCTGPGLPAGTADPTNRAFPIDSLSALLANYPVAGGDRVFVDTGLYTATATNSIVINDRNMGSADAPLIIQGSTNVLAGGTRFVGNGTTNGITIRNTRSIKLYNLRIQGAQNGISVLNSADLAMSEMELNNNQTNGLWVSGVAGLDLRHARMWGNGQFGYNSVGSKGAESLAHATIWGNRFGAVSTDKGLSVSNSILCVTNLAPIYVEIGMSASIAGDYNLYGMVSNGIYCSNLYERADYANLRQWQEKGRDLHSLRADPLFVDPAAGDFHLQSRGGYWSNGNWAVSTDTSWAIDAGDPTSTAIANEPAPNGTRINLGAYGGTTQASKSDTNSPALLAVTLSDGGVAPDGQPLYWLYRGIGPTNTVNIYYFDGADWILVNSGIGIGAAPYEWFSTVNPTPEALWRVVLVADTNVVGETTVPFTLRTRPLTYYVNDDGPVDVDIYTTAIGSPTNRGYVSNSPLHSIQAVLDRYQLAGGDEVKVDTGVYVLSAPVFISLFSSGEAGNATKFTGSTNWVEGGSWMQASGGPTNAAFQFYAAHDVRLSNFRLTGFTNGVVFEESSVRCTLSDLDVAGSSGAGIQSSMGDENRMQRVLVRDGLGAGVYVAQGKFAIENCVLWSNRASALSMGQGAQLQITNSVLEAYGAGNYCYQSPTNVSVQADYNDLLIRSNAQIASIGGLQYEKLPQWVRATVQDQHSLSTDPLFHDPANGDFHVRSVAGRYQTDIGWITDVPDPGTPDFSPLIDMGAPQTAWSNEPVPRGTRCNIGLYGNTIYASKSNTNAWLQAVTAMSGGMLSGGINLIWGYGGNVNTNEKVQLEYSYDNGVAHWIPIGPAITVSLGGTYWQSDMGYYPSSPAGRWRLYLVGTPSVVDMTDTYFGLNPPFEYYVNDGDVAGDVAFMVDGVPMVMSIGSDTNTGFYPDVPKLTLKSLLQDVDIEPGDQILVNTGIYDMSDTNTWVRWEASDGVTSGLPVVVRGSTNAPGSLFRSTNTAEHGTFFRMEASHMVLQDLRFSGESLEFAGNGLVVSNLSVTNQPGSAVSMLLVSEGSRFSDVQLDRGNFSASGFSNRIERLRQRWGTTSLSGTNVALVNSAIYATNHNAFALDVNAAQAAVSNCTIVAPRGTALRKRGIYDLRSGHNILVAGGSETNSAIAWEDGALYSDWNNLVARDSAWIGSRNGKWEKLAYWQLASGQDANSVSFDTTNSFQSESDGDFHLYSTAGRWSPILNRWDTDTVHSVLIDLGDPWLGVGSEPWYDGGRRNLGAYGGTAQASKSITNFWLTALSHNDGGVVKGTNVVLRWTCGNEDGQSVVLQYSADGVTWSNIATRAADEGSYRWDTSGFPDSFAAYWRVVAEDGSGGDTNDYPFALRNQPHVFYVNDADPAADVYCSALGSAANSGLSNSAPKLSLQQILDAYDLEGGDAVYLDTGTYSTNADTRVIWSRGGTTNADVVIQGNPNTPYATVLERTGSGSTIGLDVKASYVQLKDMNVRGLDRGIRLESNRNVTVQGVVVGASAAGPATGLDARGVQETTVRNSGFWKTAIGVNLQNASDTILENLTFAGSTVAGIQLQNTVRDTLQNNMFVPAAGAYAYSIGDSVSLLADAAMDYNLYDFSGENTTFYIGATNYYSGPTNDPLRRWQIGRSGTDGFPGMERDYRSAIGPADLADAEFAGDFHPRSAYGRWVATATGGDWTWDDTNTSWAVDHGNPESDCDLEPAENGGRINVGMYGNTAQASMGNDSVSLEARTMNDPGLVVSSNDQDWVWIWSAHLVDSNETVAVQFSGDCGLTWTTLTNLSAYEEYYVWRASPEFQTAGGAWRVIGNTFTNLWDANDSCFMIRYRDLGILSRPYPVSGLMRFEWEGGIQGRRYEIRYSDDFGKTWILWDAKYNGPATINMSNFLIPVGGSKLSYTFEDRTSYLHRQRWYRIYQYDPSAE
ncbi:MAG: right-handed parallel beta-helix repeat-containing protein [Kiritimatiellia bacterium]